MNTQHDITAGGQTLDPPTPPRKPHKLLWIDLETTALSRTEAKILEIGMIVTNLDGTEDGDRFILPVRPDHVSLYDLDPKVLRMHLDNGLLDTVMETEPEEFGYANVARNLGAFLDTEASQYVLHPAGTNVDYDIDVLTNQLGPPSPPRLAPPAHQPQKTRPHQLPPRRPSHRRQPLPKPRRHPPSPGLHPSGHQRLHRLPRHHPNRHPRRQAMSWINDPVNSPKHYTDSHPGMECIDLTADTTFCLGNCCKYLWRYHSKGRPLEDLEKARWYLCRVIDYGEKIAWTRQQYDILTALVAHTVGVEARTWAKLKQGYPDLALVLIDELIKRERDKQ